MDYTRNATLLMIRARIHAPDRTHTHTHIIRYGYDFWGVWPSAHTHGSEIIAYDVRKNAPPVCAAYNRRSIKRERE